MDHVFNLQRLASKMKKHKPAKHKLYLFFCGVTKSLSVDELMEMKKTAANEYEKFVDHLDEAISKNSKK